MRTIQIDEANSVVLYSTAKEMPISRYSTFQKYLLLHTGVGDSMESVSAHFTKLHGFLAHKMHDDAMLESENLHYNFWSILQGVDFESYAFACLVHAINGEKLTDISEENLKLIILELSAIGLTKEAVEFQVDDIKKKINDDIIVFFPDKVDDSGMIQFYADLQRKVLLTEQLIAGSPNEKQILEIINSIEKSFSEMARPKNFKPGDGENCVTELESNYEHLCSLLEMNNIQGAKSLTVIEFYSRLEYFKKVHSKNPKL